MTQPLLANKISTSIYFRILRGYKHSAVLHSAGPIPWWGPEITNGREVVCDASGTEVCCLFYGYVKIQIRICYVQIIKSFRFMRSVWITIFRQQGFVEMMNSSYQFGRKNWMIGRI